ncbi:Uncharacterised protein [Burkholderia pseudomallei]|nr:Uncharacterised protein [Burkholderia pseudomallei]CPJ25187.1 Uncharacterised protein [Burkholderia pseudomallei]
MNGVGAVENAKQITRASHSSYSSLSASGFVSCGVMPPGMKRPCFFVPPTVSESHHVWNCLIWSGCQLSGTPNSRSGTLPSV